MLSPGTGRRRSGQIPVNRRPGPGERRRRRTRGVWWLDFGQSSKWWGCQRGCTAAAIGACRGAPLFRRGGATAAAMGGRRASVGARGGAGVVVRRREGRGTELGVGVPMATGRRGSEPVEGPARARRPGLPFVVVAQGPGRRRDRWSAVGSTPHAARLRDREGTDGPWRRGRPAKEDAARGARG
jgi:hypothetical protein